MNNYVLSHILEFIEFDMDMFEVRDVSRRFYHAMTEMVKHHRDDVEDNDQYILEYAYNMGDAKSIIWLIMNTIPSKTFIWDSSLLHDAYRCGLILDDCELIHFINRRHDVAIEHIYNDIIVDLAVDGEIYIESSDMIKLLIDDLYITYRYDTHTLLCDWCLRMCAKGRYDTAKYIIEKCNVDIEEHRICKIKRSRNYHQSMSILALLRDGSSDQ